MDVSGWRTMVWFLTGHKTYTTVKLLCACTPAEFKAYQFLQRLHEQGKLEDGFTGL